MRSMIIGLIVVLTTSSSAASQDAATAEAAILLEGLRVATAQLRNQGVEPGEPVVFDKRPMRRRSLEPTTTMTGDSAWSEAELRLMDHPPVDAAVQGSFVEPIATVGQATDGCSILNRQARLSRTRRP